VLALILLIVALLKQLIALVGFLLALVKLAIVIGLVSWLMMLQMRGRRSPFWRGF
jgi:hypothetical protein